MASLLSFDGIEGTIAKLDRLLELLESAEIKKSFQAPAEQVRDQAKVLVRVKTGRLQEGIFAAPGDPEIPGWIVGVDVRKILYARIIEQGGQPHAMRLKGDRNIGRYLAIGLARGGRPIWHKAFPYLHPAANLVAATAGEPVRSDIWARIEAALR
jgi:hypothetical protein